jgi:sulfite oxidase
MPVPDLDTKSYKLAVSIEGARKSTTLNFEDLKKKFKKQTTAVVLQCAGNRRNEMIKIKPVKGLNWDSAAISLYRKFHDGRNALKVNIMPIY